MNMKLPTDSYKLESAGTYGKLIFDFRVASQKWVETN